MILAFDTYYNEDKAKTVCVTFGDWLDTEPMDTFEETINGIAPYEPGAFFKRELPCILSLLKKINTQSVQVIIVDGYVFLDDQGTLGLGGHLYKELDETIPVVGVSKSRFSGIELNQRTLIRGESKRPLYITAIGVELQSAVEWISSMHGNFRIPSMLQQLDMKTRE